MSRRTESASNALLVQAEIHQWIQSEQARSITTDMVRNVARERYNAPLDPEYSTEILLTHAHTTTALGKTYHLDHKSLNIVKENIERVIGWKAHLSAFPSRFGFIYFEGPVHYTEDSHAHPIRALGWFVGDSTIGGDVPPFTGESLTAQDDYVEIILFTEYEQGKIAIPTSTHPWRFGESTEDIPHAEMDQQDFLRARDKRRGFAAILELLAQHILVATPQQADPRTRQVLTKKNWKGKPVVYSITYEPKAAHTRSQHQPPRPFYSIALEEQLKHVRVMKNDPRTKPAWVESVGQPHYEDSERAARVYDYIISTLEVAEPVYVGKDICALLKQSNTVAPQDTPLREHDLIARHTWVYFQDDIGDWEPAESRPSLKRTVALLCTTLFLRELQDAQSNPGYEIANSTAHAPEATWIPALAIFPFYTIPGQPFALPYTEVVLPLNTPLAQVNEITGLETSRHDTFYRDLTASLHWFSQQQFISTTKRAAPQAHSPKHLANTRWTPEPLVRVVELRRRETPHHERDSDPVDMAWSCRWLVRGHWRQQACGEGRKEHRPIWIMPHVKGPEDKPLKPPRTTLFAVVR